MPKANKGGKTSVGNAKISTRTKIEGGAKLSPAIKAKLNKALQASKTSLLSKLKVGDVIKENGKYYKVKETTARTFSTKAKAQNWIKQKGNPKNEYSLERIPHSKGILYNVKEKFLGVTKNPKDIAKAKALNILGKKASQMNLGLSINDAIALLGKDQRAVLGSRTNKWHIIEKGDRDYARGETRESLQKIAKAERTAIKNNILGNKTNQIINKTGLNKKEIAKIAIKSQEKELGLKPGTVSNFKEKIDTNSIKQQFRDMAVRVEKLRDNLQFKGDMTVKVDGKDVDVTITVGERKDISKIHAPSRAAISAYDSNPMENESPLESILGHGYTVTPTYGKVSKAMQSKIEDAVENAPANAFDLRQKSDNPLAEARALQRAENKLKALAKQLKS